MKDTGCQEIETTIEYEFRYKNLEKICSCEHKHILEIPYKIIPESDDILKYRCPIKERDIYITNASCGWFTKIEDSEKQLIVTSEKIKIITIPID